MIAYHLEHGLHSELQKDSRSISDEVAVGTDSDVYCIFLTVFWGFALALWWQNSSLTGTEQKRRPKTFSKPIQHYFPTELKHCKWAVLLVQWCFETSLIINRKEQTQNIFWLLSCSQNTPKSSSSGGNQHTREKWSLVCLIKFALRGEMLPRYNSCKKVLMAKNTVVIKKCLFTFTEWLKGQRRAL